MFPLTWEPETMRLLNIHALKNFNIHIDTDIFRNGQIIVGKQKVPRMFFFVAGHGRMA